MTTTKPATTTALIRVNIESPFRASTAVEEAENIAYARACLLDSLSRGEAPFAMHLLYTQVLQDAVASQRAKGIAAGCAFIPCCQLEAVYFDHGITDGMKKGMAVAIHHGKIVEFRSLQDRPRPSDKLLHEQEIPHTWTMCTICTGHHSAA